MAGSTVRRALATYTSASAHVAQRLRALALSCWAARGCLVNRQPGRPSHHAVPASHAACVAPPTAPPTPPPSKSVRPLSRMRRARRRLRRPCLGLPSHWAFTSASQDRRTGVGESCARSRIGQMARWSRSSGSAPLLLPALRQTTDAVLTWSSTAHRLCEEPCAATRPLCRRGPARASHNPAPWRTMVPCCGLQSGASEPLTQSSAPEAGAAPRAARQRPGARASPTGPAGFCEPQPPPPGRDGGGRLWL